MKPHFTDGLNFLSKMTWKRAFNAVQVVSSYLYARVTGKAVHWGMPVSISLEPTTSCNLRCPECPSGLRSFTRPTGMLQSELYRHIIDQLHDKLLYLIFYFQGEPYLHKQFLEMVSYASKKGIYTATSTNAHYLDDDTARKTVESGLDRLIVSIDGTTQETYSAYRIGGKLDKVLEGTRNVVKWKKELKSKTPHIMFQFLVVRPNEHQLEDVKALAKELGVDEVVFKTAQIYDYQNGSPLIPTIDYYSRYQNNGNGNYSIKNKLLNHCWKMWHSCVITWDGLVVPCCFDKDAEYRFGDLKEEAFKAVWQGANYSRFRQAVLRSRAEVEMCRNCTEGTRVWA
ncbi:SPASM domain-containing protein [Pontibacter burrus]|uniref:Radical SAM protein n=1 Tax=Pontibacter burrus TaxID=2704466 RepID=A0A6B3LKC9_9BACT|nr:SPASM domain-containing protein [Pontibacter burrus]NEM96403.1 radical SAM protein [Pontibacter burrus]